MGGEGTLLDAARWSLPRGTLRFYWEVARRGYRRYATYRAATIGGIFTNTIFGFMRAYVLIALFAARPHAGGYTVTDALTYTWLTQASIMTVYLWGWYEIAERIRSGDVVSDLQRPADFQAYWLAQDLGRGLYHALFRGIPPFLIGALAFHLRLPHHPWTIAIFAFSLAMSVCLSFSMRFIVNVLAFWTLDYRGVNALAAVFWTFLSGFVLPIALFPPPWREVALALPFAGMVQTPVDIFLEKGVGWSLLPVLGQQIGWTVLLLVAGRLLLSRATRTLVIHGG